MRCVDLTLSFAIYGSLHDVTTCFSYALCFPWSKRRKICFTLLMFGLVVSVTCSNMYIVSRIASSQRAARLSTSFQVTDSAQAQRAFTIHIPAISISLENKKQKTTLDMHNSGEMPIISPQQSYKYTPYMRMALVGRLSTDVPRPGDPTMSRVAEGRAALYKPLP